MIAPASENSTFFGWDIVVSTNLVQENSMRLTLRKEVRVNNELRKRAAKEG